MVERSPASLHAHHVHTQVWKLCKRIIRDHQAKSSDPRSVTANGAASTSNLNDIMTSVTAETVKAVTEKTDNVLKPTSSGGTPPTAFAGAAAKKTPDYSRKKHSLRETVVNRDVQGE